MVHPVADRLVQNIALAFILASIVGLLLMLVQAMGLGGVGLLVFWLVMLIVGALLLFIA